MWKHLPLLSLLCSGWFVVTGCQSEAGGSGPSGGASVAALHRPSISATGRVEGWREADVASKLPGRIRRFECDEGDEVVAGVPVVRLEDADLRAGVREAAARATEAAHALERMRALRAQAIVSASEVDHAAAAYRSSAAALDAAQAMLDYATIRAPFSGTLLRKFKEVGEGVSVSGPPDPVFRIADLSRLKVIAEVAEIDIGTVQMGQRAEVSADAYPGEPFAAVVSRIGDAVGRKRIRSDDPREQWDEKVVEVELALASDARLKSGMTVDVVFHPLSVHAGNPAATGSRVSDGRPPA